jgi:hypothetical protein
MGPQRRWEVAELQVCVARLSADQPEADLAPLPLPHHAHAIADGNANLDVPMLLAEEQEHGREQVFARDRTGGKRQLTRRFAKPNG